MSITKFQIHKKIIKSLKKAIKNQIMQTHHPITTKTNTTQALMKIWLPTTTKKTLAMRITVIHISAKARIAEMPGTIKTIIFKMTTATISKEVTVIVMKITEIIIPQTIMVNNTKTIAFPVQILLVILKTTDILSMMQLKIIH